MPSYTYYPQFLVILSLLSVSVTEDILHRQKRFLLYYPNGGTFKMVIGFAIPIKLGLKQNLSCGWNFQFQYLTPQTTNDTRYFPPIYARSREKRQDFRSDRALAYEGLEAIMDRSGISGRSCLLRSICENAMENLHHEANGLYGHLLHIVLTPDYDDGIVEPDLDPVYLDAKRAGEFGVDCATLYPECRHNNLLDLFSLLDD